MDNNKNNRDQIQRTPNKKNGAVKKDRYFTIRYRVNGVLKEEGLGWASEGWTEEKPD